MAEFDSWLRQLAAAGKGGVVLTGASRTRKYTLAFTLTGDWSTATLDGQVRSAPDAASPLADFTIGTPSYSAGTGLTSFTASLAAGSSTDSTGSLPAAAVGDPWIDLPFDFTLTPSGGDEELLLGGVLRLLGRITA